MAKAVMSNESLSAMFISIFIYDIACTACHKGVSDYFLYFF
jgi:hypothetical protein